MKERIIKWLAARKSVKSCVLSNVDVLVTYDGLLVLAGDVEFLAMRQEFMQSEIGLPFNGKLFIQEKNNEQKKSAKSFSCDTCGKDQQ